MVFGSEVFVTKGAAVSDVNGGGPNLGANDGPVATYANVDATHLAGGAHDVDNNNGSAGWGATQVDDNLCYDTGGAKEFGVVVSLSVGGDDDVIRVQAFSGAAFTDLLAVNVNVGGAWATIQSAFDVLTTAWGASHLNIGPGTYDEGQIDVDTNTFTNAKVLVVEGYYAAAGDKCDNAGTLTRPIITSAGAVIWLLQMNAVTVRHTALKYLDLNGNGQATYCAGDTDFSNDQNWSAHHCRLHHATADGIRTRSRGIAHYDCELDHNGAKGYCGWLGGGYTLLSGCSIHDNTADGVEIATSYGVVLSDNLIYDNGGDGVLLSGDLSVHQNMKITGNVLHGNTGDGMEVNDLAPSCEITTNTSVSNGGVGFKFSGELSVAHIDFNHTHDNTGGVTNLAALPGDNNQTGDPLFANVGDGTEDFSSGDGPLRATGFPAALPTAGTSYPDIGLQHEDAGGGGGGGVQLGAFQHPFR